MGIKIHTHKEAKLNLNAAFLALSNKVKNHTIRIEEIGNYIPGGVMVQDLKAEVNTYMNNYGCDYLRHDQQELKNMGARYFESFFPPEEITVLKVQLIQFINVSDFTKTQSFFQRVRPDQQTPYKWFLTTSRLYESADSTTINLMNVAIEVNDIHYAGHKMSNLYNDYSFIRIHYQEFCSLTKREKEIIKLIGNDNNSYTIADTLNISIHTVNNHRKNIASKLHITSFSQLIKFAIAFDLL